MKQIKCEIRSKHLPAKFAEMAAKVEHPIRCKDGSTYFVALGKYDGENAFEVNYISHGRTFYPPVIWGHDYLNYEVVDHGDAESIVATLNGLNPISFYMNPDGLPETLKFFIAE